MSKLKNKVFFTIFSILSLFSILLFILYNVEGYLNKQKSIRDNLNMPMNNKEEPPKNDMPSENIKFIDATIYTVLLNNEGIIDVINHSNNDLSNEEIILLAEDILNNNPKNIYIGNLYFASYSYHYMENKSLVILDNTLVKEELILSLKVSSIFLIILEVMLYFISKKITNWITIPVKDSFQKQKEFIADASHELKTPISVILSSTELLEDNPKDTKWLKNIKNEALRMNHLVTDLLELSMSEDANTYKLELKNLSKTVLLAILPFEGKTFEHNLKLEYEIDEDIKMMMNENSIKELVAILLDNAIKHSKEKGVIEIILKEHNNTITLLVTNEGASIPFGEEEKIFERFYRVDKSRNREDNRYGLGLAIAKNIVLQHHGTIKASSLNGKTTFKVTLKK